MLKAEHAWRSELAKTSIAEMVEEANAPKESLTSGEIFGFTCAPVNLGLMEHVQYFVWIGCFHQPASGRKVIGEKHQWQYRILERSSEFILESRLLEEEVGISSNVYLFERISNP